MSDFDEQSEAEDLDDDKLGSEYPPEEPLGVDDYGTTAAEERVDEPLEERVAREEPDVTPETMGGTGAVGPDGALDVDDIASGDTTTRDVAQELEAPAAAEEDAVHVADDAY